MLNTFIISQYKLFIFALGLWITTTVLILLVYVVLPRTRQIGQWAQIKDTDNLSIGVLARTRVLIPVTIVFIAFFSFLCIEAKLASILPIIAIFFLVLPSNTERKEYSHSKISNINNNNNIAFPLLLKRNYHNYPKKSKFMKKLQLAIFYLFLYLIALFIFNLFVDFLFSLYIETLTTSDIVHYVNPNSPNSNSNPTSEEKIPRGLFKLGALGGAGYTGAWIYNKLKGTAVPRGRAALLTTAAGAAIHIADRLFDHLDHVEEVKHTPSVTEVKVKGRMGPWAGEGKVKNTQSPIATEAKALAEADKQYVENQHLANENRLKEEKLKSIDEAEIAVLEAKTSKTVHATEWQDQLDSIDFATKFEKKVHAANLKKQNDDHELALKEIANQRELEHKQYELDCQTIDEQIRLKNLRESLEVNKLTDNSSSDIDFTYLQNYIENKDSFVFFQDQDYIFEKTWQGNFDYPIEVKKGSINISNLSDYRDLQDNSLQSSPGNIDEQKESFTLSENVDKSENSSTLPLSENVDWQENSVTTLSSSSDYTDIPLSEMFMDIFNNFYYTPISEMSTTFTILALLLIGLITISALISIWMIIIYDQIKKPLREYKEKNPEFLNFRHSVAINKLIIAWLEYKLDWKFILLLGLFSVLVLSFYYVKLLGVFIYLYKEWKMK